MSQMKYTDIGHSKPNDVIWIQIDGDLFMLTAGQSRTHELIWGGEVDIEEHWRGRFELDTGYCSIAPPAKSLNRRRPPDSLLSQLNRQFNVMRFYYFTGGVDSFTPNPREKR